MLLTYRGVITRALLAGAVVGVVLAGYLFFVVEPQIDAAVALEDRLGAEAHEHPTSEVHDHGDGARFTRSEQVSGGLAANVIYGLVVSAVFGTVFTALRHRLPGRSDLVRSVWLASVAFGAVALMPALKYPPNPPAVGDPETVGARTVLYLALIVASLVLVWLLTRLSGLLRRRLDDPTRIVAVAVLAAVGYGVLLVAFPGNPDTIDPAVPAGLVWDFRIRSIGGLALLWVGLGIGLGWLLERDQRRHEGAPQPAGVAT